MSDDTSRNTDGGGRIPLAVAPARSETSEALPSGGGAEGSGKAGGADPGREGTGAGYLSAPDGSRAGEVASRPETLRKRRPRDDKPLGEGPELVPRGEPLDYYRDDGRDVDSKTQDGSLGKGPRSEKPETVPGGEPLGGVLGGGGSASPRGREYAKGRCGKPRPEAARDAQRTDPPQSRNEERSGEERPGQPPRSVRLRPPSPSPTPPPYPGTRHTQLRARHIPQVPPEPTQPQDASPPGDDAQEPLPMLTAVRVPSEYEEDDDGDEEDGIVVATPVKRNLWTKISVAVLILVLVGVILGITLRDINGVPPTPDPFVDQTLPPSAQPPEPNITAMNELRSSICESLPSSCPSLSNDTSPQHQALAWLASDPKFVSYSRKRKMQRYALAALYYSTKGWDMISGSWVDLMVDECEWYRVKCTRHWVSEILLGTLLSGGMLPRELAMLNASLKSVYLDNNKLSGTIPTEYGMLTSLNYLFLNQNRLRGSVPSELGRLADLEALSVRSNDLTGSMPEEICNLRDGSLASLWADCRCPGNPLLCVPEFFCGCCTNCCDEDQCCSVLYDEDCRDAAISLVGGPLGEAAGSEGTALNITSGSEGTAHNKTPNDIRW